MLKRLFLLLFLATSLVSFAQSTIRGKVVSVTDGDTFRLLVEGEGEPLRIRMDAIDAPEMQGSQPFCRASKEYLTKLIGGKDVSVIIMSTDRYGRKIGRVRTDDVDDVNLEMLKGGFAWHYSYFDSTARYAKAEKVARKTKVGLWADAHPINPYEWRKTHKRK